MLTLDNLQIKFPTPYGEFHAVRGVNLNIFKGQIYGVVGESGCGKTAMGRSILQILPPSAKVTGRILFKGEDLLAKSEKEIQKLRGRKIAMIFQDPAAALNPLFTIGDQIFGIMKRHGIAPREEFQDRAEALLNDLVLPRPKDILKTYPHQLSGGMQQRVMIALALATEPDLIIADEITTALDVTIQYQLLRLLVRLRDERGITIIMITHDLAVAAETCDKMAAFYRGQVIEQGTVREIFGNARHPYTQGLLAAVPNPKNLGQELKVIPGFVPKDPGPIPGCPYAPRCESVMDICNDLRPSNVVITESHKTACHLYSNMPDNGVN